ncbi:MAG: HEAT repeat domain-containing protein [Deltaproteobacteria bacterium]|nr:HEAT repeat domain-containing protein [Deltaproteobacteria bacterium]
MEWKLEATLVAALVLCWPATAAAETLELAESNVQHALTLAVTGQTISARACRSARGCTPAGGQRFAIPADADPVKAKAEGIIVGAGMSVALVTVPARRGPGRWVLLLAASKLDGAASVSPLLKGFLDRPKGTVTGERKTSVLLREPAAAGERLVLGKQYENATICGRPATMAAKALDPKTLSWDKTMARTLTNETRSTAVRVFAEPLADPLGLDHPQLLHGVLASSAVGRERGGMTDRKLETRWAENRPAEGSGEFIVMTSSEEVPVLGFDLVIRPTVDLEPPGAAPRTLFIATRNELFEVTMPGDAWLEEPGTAYSVTLPRPVKSDCVAVVLDQAYLRPDGQAVSITELRARTELDATGADFAALAKALDGPDEQSGMARALLLRSGKRAVQATIAAYPELGAVGRRRALDVIDSGDCGATVAFFVERYVGRDRGDDFDPDLDPLARHAHDRLRLCRPQATASLTTTVQKEPPGKRRGWAARELATIAPGKAVGTIVEVLDQGDKDTRRGMRGALATAVRHQRGRSAALTELDPQRFAGRPLVTRIDVLRALGPTLGSLAPARPALASVIAADDSFRTRYLIQGPAAQLAAAGDPAALAFVRQSLNEDRSHHVRVQAARVAGGVASLATDLGRALGDPQPRVRQAALEALAETQGKVSPGTEARARSLLKDDPWTFVRVGAATAMAGRAPNAAGDEALGDALDDDSPLVREAALRAIGKRKSVATASRVHDLADNPKQPMAVRVAAVSALGALCHADSAPLLYKLALRAGYAQLPYDQPLGLAALAALSDLKPADLAQQLAPLLSKNEIVPRLIRAIARDVIRSPGTCGGPATKR